MTDYIKVNAELELPAPTGDILKSIIVNVKITPPNGSIIVYGMTSPSELTGIQLNGSASNIELPFINGSIKVLHLGDVTDASFQVLGFQDNLNRI